VCVEVSDNAGSPVENHDDAGRPLVFREGVGLGNTRARLAALYSDNQSLTLSSAHEGGVCARVTLPAGPRPVA
jgi:sensor histidine kinase YesM